MEKFKRFMLYVIIFVGVVLLGYHLQENCVAFVNPRFSNISFTLAIIFWSLIVMWGLKEFTQKFIRDRWKEKSLKNFKAILTALMALNIGATIANLDVLGKVITENVLIPILFILFTGTMLYALRKNKKEKGKWIGEEPLKGKSIAKEQPKGGDIEH